MPADMLPERFIPIYYLGRSISTLERRLRGRPPGRFWLYRDNARVDFRRAIAARLRSLV